jgi:hypothetical protein
MQEARDGSKVRLLRVASAHLQAPSGHLQQGSTHILALVCSFVSQAVCSVLLRGSGWPCAQCNYGPAVKYFLQMQLH